MFYPISFQETSIFSQMSEDTCEFIAPTFNLFFKPMVFDDS